MPVPPTSISAATITNQAMPMEIRMPVMIVGAAAGSTTNNALRTGLSSKVLATSSQSLRTADTPKAVFHEHGPDRTDEDHKNRRDVAVLQGEQGQRHPGQRGDGLEHLNEGVRPASPTVTFQSESPGGLPTRQPPKARATRPTE